MSNWTIKPFSRGSSPKQQIITIDVDRPGRRPDFFGRFLIATEIFGD